MAEQCGNKHVLLSYRSGDIVQFKREPGAWLPRSPSEFLVNGKDLPEGGP